MGWIKTSEKLPKADEPVFICGIAGGREFLSASVRNIDMHGSDAWVFPEGFFSDGDDPQITHWMPLPDPPPDEEVAREKEKLFTVDSVTGEGDNIQYHIKKNPNIPNEVYHELGNWGRELLKEAKRKEKEQANGQNNTTD